MMSPISPNVGVGSVGDGRALCSIRTVRERLPKCQDGINTYLQASG